MGARDESDSRRPSRDSSRNSIVDDGAGGSEGSESSSEASDEDSETFLWQSRWQGRRRTFSESMAIDMQIFRQTATPWKARHALVLARSGCMAVPGLLYWSFTLWHATELYSAACPALALLCLHLLVVRVELDSLWREAKREELARGKPPLAEAHWMDGCTCLGVGMYLLLCAEALLLVGVGATYHVMGESLLVDRLTGEPQREWTEYHAASVAIAVLFYWAAALGVANIALKVALSCCIGGRGRQAALSGETMREGEEESQPDEESPHEQAIREQMRPEWLRTLACLPPRPVPRVFAWPLHGFCCLSLVALLSTVVVALVLWLGPGPCASGSSDDCYAICDPIDVHACALPWPSSYFTIPDNSSATGWRVAFGPRSLPYTRWGRNVDSRAFNEADGFAVSTPIFFHMDAEIELDSDAQGEFTARYYTIERSLDVDATPTILLDLDSLHVVPHFVEIVRATTQHTLLSITPAVPLNYSSHYAVGVRNLHGRHNQNLMGMVRPSAGFTEALKSAAAYDLADSDIAAAERSDYDLFLAHLEWDRDLERAKALEREILPAFGRVGFTTSHLQLAWDFRTQSAEHSVEVLSRQREAALNEVARRRGSGAAVLRIDKELQGVRCAEGHLSRRFVGTLQVPNFLESVSDDRIDGWVLRRDAGGRISAVPEGERLHDFLIIMPCSVTKAGAPPPVGFMQYGHGIFGSREEATANYVQGVAEAGRFVVLAADFEGMHTFNLFTVLRVALSRIHQFPSVTEPLAQAFIANSALLEAALSNLDHPSFTRADGAPVFGGVRREDLVNVYYGVSLGGILGAAYASLAASAVQRAALGNPGAPFALILPRSAQWTPLRFLLRFQISSDGDEAIAIALAQHLWSTVEGSGWVGGGSSLPLLIQTSRGDAIVSALSAELLARAAGAFNLEPVVRSIYGISNAELGQLTPSDSNRTRVPSVLVEWDSTAAPRRATTAQDGVEGLAYVPGRRDEGDASVNTHQCVRYQPEAISQIVDFLGRGKVTQPCPEGAPCTMACG